MDGEDLGQDKDLDEVGDAGNAETSAIGLIYELIRTSVIELIQRLFGSSVRGV